MWRCNAVIGAAPAAAQAPPGAGAAVREAAKAVILGALDSQLRFVGGERAECAKLEAEFMTALARSLPRTVFILLLGLAYVVCIIVYMASGAPWLLGYWAYASAPLSFFVIIPVIRAGPVWADMAASIGAGVCLFTIGAGASAGGPGVRACPGSDTSFELMLFSAMPLLCAFVFTPRWRQYAALCAGHAAHAIIVLSALGPMTPCVVCLASFLGASASYLQERRSREHFVSAHANGGVIGGTVRKHACAP